MNTLAIMFANILVKDKVLIVSSNFVRTSALMVMNNGTTFDEPRFSNFHDINQTQCTKATSHFDIP